MAPANGRGLARTAHGGPATRPRRPPHAHGHRTQPVAGGRIDSRSPRLWLLALTALMTGAGVPAAAQQTRAELLERQRAERAREIRPHEPALVERALLFLEAHRLRDPLEGGLFGVSPHLGGFPSGSGFSLGASYRTALLSRRLALEARAAGSRLGYKAVEGRADTPRLLGGRIEIGADWAWRDYPREDFYGLGRSSALSDRTTYRLRWHDAGGRLVVKPTPWLAAGSRLGLLAAAVAPGTDPRFPATVGRFTDAEVPGLAGVPPLAYHELFVDAGSRDAPGSTRGGGRYRASWRRYDDRRGGAFDVERVDAELRHVFPIFDTTRSVAVRARVSRVEARQAARVPFFLVPSVGGHDTLRGFRDFRFRDASVVLLNAEYRWQALGALDLALFVDAADVAPSWRALQRRRLKTAWGLGFRFNTSDRVVLRVDVGTGGGEGTRGFVKFGQVF